MPEIICNTSPLQYLHQTNLLDVARDLLRRVTVPPAVVHELEQGRAQGVDVPDIRELGWIVIRAPISRAAAPLVTDLGPGETQVLMLALETEDPIVLLDDALARQHAELLGLRFTGTLGLLLEAKRAGLIPVVAPVIDQLQALRFRLAPSTKAAVLKLAGE